jgi:hypothetical protein
VSLSDFGYCFETLDSIFLNPSRVDLKYLQYAIYEKFSIVTVQRQKAEGRF